MSKSRRRPQRSYFFWSIVLHLLLLSVFVIGFQFRDAIPVFELTPHANDTINAVVLGEVKTSRIMPKQEPPLLPQEKPVLKKKVKPEPTPALEKPVPAADKPLPIQKKVPVVIEKKVVKEKKSVKETKEKKIDKEALALTKKPVPVEKKKLVKAEDVQSILDEFKAETKANKKKQQALVKKKWERALTQAENQDIEKTFRESAALPDVRTKSTVSKAVANGVVDKYKALIIQSISEQWRVPAGVSKQAVSELTIRLAPGGTVLNVTISRSSGNLALDRSAQSAVMKASPLPVPKEAEAFKAFREFVLKVKPEYVMDNGVG